MKKIRYEERCICALCLCLLVGIICVDILGDWGFTFKLWLNVIGLLTIVFILIFTYWMDSIVQVTQNLRNKIEVAYKNKLEGLNREISRKINVMNLEKDKSNIDLLSPVSDFERYRTYIESLKKAVDNPDAKNIALTGLYGSGKSSILKTFQETFPEYKYIKVSLASFVEGHEAVNLESIEHKSSGNETGGQGVPEPKSRFEKTNSKGFEERLEYSILQQLFYQVKTNKIPFSRFGRIERASNWHRSFQTVVAVLFLSSCLVLFGDNFLINKIGIPTDILANTWVHWPSVFAFSFSCVCLIIKVVNLLDRISLKSLKFREATLDVEKKNNVSIMNRYMDEIMYLFQELKYDIVIFEDIDRFDGTQIFTKLRELNLILNQTEEIDKKVVFIYALRDEIFVSAEERTKFFDYILPVIPYVNVSNSASLFRRKFEELEIPEEKLPSDFITDISVYVDDMRVLTNVVNEFKLYREILNPKLDLRKLLSIILYKNLYPEDFSLLHQNQGIVYDVFANKLELINAKFKCIENKIADLDIELEKIDAEFLKNEQELDFIVITAFLKFTDSFSSNYSNYYVDNHYVDLSRLLDGYYAHKIWDGKVSKSGNAMSRANFSSILGEDFDYEERLQIIQDKKDNKIKKLQDQRKLYQDNMVELKKKTVAELVSTGVDISIASPTLNNNKYLILKTLLERGYIDEQYFYYISLFQEGMLTPSDQNFLMNVKFNTPLGIDYKLQNVKSLMLNLSNTDFDRAAIVNLDLMDYLFNNVDLNGEKCQAVIKQIKDNPSNGLHVVDAFLRKGNNIEPFVEFVVKNWGEILDDLLDDNKYSSHLVLRFISLAFKVSSIDDLRNFCNKRLVKFLNHVDNYNQFFRGLSSSKIIEILELLDLKVSKLTLSLQNESDINPYLIEGWHYELNYHNIWFLLENHEGIHQTDHLDNVYTPIYFSKFEPLRDYVNENISDFVNNLVLDEKNTKEAEEPFLNLLMHKNLSEDEKIELINHNSTPIKHVEDVKDTILIKQLYSVNHVQFSLENVKYYYKANGLDEVLISFLNNKAVFWECEIPDEDLTEDEIEMIRVIMRNSDVEDSVGKAILQNESLADSYPEDWTVLPVDLLRYAIEKDFVIYSTEICLSIIDEKWDVFESYASKYPAEIMGDLDNLNLELDDVIILMNCSKFDSYQDQLIQYITSDMIKEEEHADFYLQYIIRYPDKAFNKECFDESVERSSNNDLKAQALYVMLEHHIIRPVSLDDYADTINDAFANINTVGEIIRLPNETPYKNILDLLNKMSVVGKLKSDDNCIWASVRKPRK